MYAISLWKLGKSDMALSAAKDLATCVPTMKLSSAVASICLICSLLYSISGAGPTINSILQMPKELLQSAKVSFIISAVDAVDQSSQLQAVVSSSRRSLSSKEEIMEMHLLIALSKVVCFFVHVAFLPCIIISLSRFQHSIKLWSLSENGVLMNCTDQKWIRTFYQRAKWYRSS